MPKKTSRTRARAASSAKSNPNISMYVSLLVVLAIGFIAGLLVARVHYHSELRSAGDVIMQKDHIINMMQDDQTPTATPSPTGLQY